MFDDPFCHFLTFSRYFLESLSKLLPSSAEDRFEGKKSFEERSVFSMIFAFRAKKGYISSKQSQQQCKNSD